MGPAKPPVSSRVITEDDWHLGIVISIMVVGPRRAVSPPSISGPLQNIYSPFCRWKNNSPLAYHRNVTKREWISPLMFQRIKRRTPAHTQACIYKREPRKKKKGKKTHRYTLHLLSIVFKLLILTLASEALWQTPHRCYVAPFCLFSGSGYRRTTSFWTILFDWRSEHHQSSFRFKGYFGHF